MWLLSVMIGEQREASVAKYVLISFKGAPLSFRDWQCTNRSHEEI